MKAPSFITDVLQNSSKNPNGSYRELTTDKMPLLVCGRSRNAVLKLNWLDSTHHCNPSALTSVDLMSPGIDVNTERLFVSHFWRLNPPLLQSAVKSFTICIASFSVAVDFRQSST